MYLRLLLFGDGVVQQRGAGANLGPAAGDPDRPERKPGIHVAVEAERADRAAIPAAGRFLVVLDELHGRKFGRAGDGDGPHVGQKGVEPVEARAQPALDMIDGVDQPGIHFDLAAPDYPDAARRADARLVVAVDVGAHRQFGFVFGRIEQLADLFVILHRRRAALDGAGDRTSLDPVAGNPHEHLGRSADQILAAAQVEEESVGRGVGVAQAAEDCRRRFRRRPGLQHPRHGFEQVALAELPLRLAHQAGIVARPAVGQMPSGSVRPVGNRASVARQAACAGAVIFEIVKVAAGYAGAAVHDDQVVGQVEHQITLIPGPFETEANRIEGEGEIVSECAVQPEMSVPAGPERREHRP